MTLKDLNDKLQRLAILEHYKIAGRPKVNILDRPAFDLIKYEAGLSESEQLEYDQLCKIRIQNYSLDEGNEK